LLDTWTNSIAVKETQCSAPFQWIRPELDTIWACYSGTQCWLPPPSYLSTMQYAAPRPQGFSTPRKIVLLWRQFNVLVLSPGSNHYLSMSQWYTVLIGCI